MSDWQPFETAPKDSTWIQIWVIDKDGEGRWCPEAYYSQREGLWITDDGYGSSVWVECYGTPTHWMPLPEPPSNVEQRRSR